MTDESFSLYHLVNQDPRYPIEAYQFVREALAYAADAMELGSHEHLDSEFDDEAATHQARRERHLTGQQLCDIVYNMIAQGIMKKSSRDKRAHFDDVYNFDDVFDAKFEICDSMAHRRT